MLCFPFAEKYKTLSTDLLPLESLLSKVYKGIGVVVVLYAAEKRQFVHYSICYGSIASRTFISLHLSNHYELLYNQIITVIIITIIITLHHHHLNYHHHYRYHYHDHHHLNQHLHYNHHHYHHHHHH